MRWSEVQSMFPDSFVLLEDLKSHVENGNVVIEEVAVIRPLADGKEVTHELLTAKARSSSTTRRSRTSSCPFTQSRTSGVTHENH